ncbi:hypothetical protein [Deinococcus xianganensis]|uniref:C1q domain-containing protein n=1 Tax=Deinococcus xianganensis TaxID=1507289 RepID=A0A6I4YFH8_9DEIO|nr:hypothetical protein [Deinococcus xianganensis]MXV20302.1 hypothetical protein [Deinococcus xianganensis]
MKIMPAPPQIESVPSWPIMVARLGGGAGSEPGQVVTTQAFARLLVQAEYDSHGAFSNSTSIYTVPQSGVYRLEGKVRVLDGSMPAGYSIGLGIDRYEGDGPSFFWGVSNPSRQGVINQRVAYFDAGDPLRLCVYADHPGVPNVGVASAEFTLDRIR